MLKKRFNTMIDAWQNLRKQCTNLLHVIFASDLLEELRVCKDNYQTIIDAHCILVRENADLGSRISMLRDEMCAKEKDWKERAKLENRDSAIAVQTIRERMRDGSSLLSNILGSRDLASRQSIIALQREVDYLRNLLKRLHK